MEMNERIKALRNELGMSQDELARKLGYKDRSTIAKIERGVNDITQSKIKAFAVVLNTTAAYLMGWTDDPYDYDTDPDNLFDTIPQEILEGLQDEYGDDNEQIWGAWKKMQLDSKIEHDKELQSANSLPSDAVAYDLSKLHRIPVLGQIAAGLPLYAEENIEGYTYTDLNGGAEYFALRVKGDSMNALRINEGDIVIVRRQSSVENGEVAVVLVDGDSATLKRFYRTDSAITLMPQSTNAEHQPQVYDPAKTRIDVLGKVVKVEFML